MALALLVQWYIIAEGVPIAPVPAFGLLPFEDDFIADKVVENPSYLFWRPVWKDVTESFSRIECPPAVLVEVPFLVFIGLVLLNPERKVLDHNRGVDAVSYRNFNIE